MLTKKYQQCVVWVLALLHEGTARCLHGAKYCLQVAMVRDQAVPPGQDLRSTDAEKLHMLVPGNYLYLLSVKPETKIVLCPLPPHDIARPRWVYGFYYAGDP